MNDEICQSTRCSVCKMPLVQTYRLRGSTTHDQEYILALNMQEKKSEILFEGKKSTITWHTCNATLELKDQSKTTTGFENYFGPFGKLKPESLEKSRENLVFTNVSISCYLYYFL